MRHSLLVGLCGVGLSLLACVAGSDVKDDNPNNEGGSSNGGKPGASGGTKSNGGRSSTGGASATGGSKSTGGTTNGTGGTTNGTGGTTNGTGGTTNGTGGTKASGGSSAAGGSSNGSGGNTSGGRGGSTNAGAGGTTTGAGGSSGGGAGGGNAGSSGSGSTTLCAPHPQFKNCQATDFAKESIFDNSKWEITEWASPNRKHSRDNLKMENGALVMKVTGGTTPGQQTTGAEILSTKNDFLHGSFRALIKTASESGTVNGFFYYLNDKSEIDVEVLSRDNSKQLVYYTIHENNGGDTTYQTYKAGFNPSAEYHEYRFDWTAAGVAYYIDGKPTVTLKGNTPYQPGMIMINHWTLSDPGWGGGPPIKDAFMYVKHIELYY